MFEVKLFVDEKNEASIICPECGGLEIIDTSQYKNTGQYQNIEWKCNCGYRIKAFVERRKHYRKDTYFTGTCTNLTTNKSTNIFIKNLSVKGIGFLMASSIHAEEGDYLKIAFILDDFKQSIIRRKVIVQRIKDNFIAAKFYDMSGLSKEIGFYLMP